MKKLLSLVMAGAMVASLVPATAFAAGDVTATAKVVDSLDLSKSEAKKDAVIDGNPYDVPQAQLKVTSVDYKSSDADADVSEEVEFTLGNAEFVADSEQELLALLSIKDDDHSNTIKGNAAYDSGTSTFTFTDGTDTKVMTAVVKDFDENSVTFKFTGKFEKDDIIILDLESELTKTSENTKATVSVDADMVTADDLVYATVLGAGLKASVKKTVDVAEEEITTLNSNGLKIEAAVGDLPTELTIKISNGFEFTDDNEDLTGTGYTKIVKEDDNELTVTVAADTDEITIKGIEIEATSAKSGAVATLTVKASNNDSATVEVAKVVDYKVNLTVDEDEDVPVIYSGVNVANKGITDDSDHMSLEVTAEETFPGAWSFKQGFNFNLPDGVYVTDVDVTNAESITDDEEEWVAAFFNAYQDGDHKNFEFKKRVFDDVDPDDTSDEGTVTFQLELVADPDFEGDVVLTMEGALVDTQSVTIAKFVKPYTVKAEQNDVIIDYRNTTVNTPIVITEAEAGLLEEDTDFALNIEDNLIDFDGDPKITVDDSSDLTVKDDDTDDGTFVFTVDDESDSAATITISDIALYMNRSIPAGGYDLEVSTTLDDYYNTQVLFAPDAIKTYATATYEDSIDDIAKLWVKVDADQDDDGRPATGTDADEVNKDSFVDDVCDYSDVVKEAFINVVTSGRDQDNLFTTKVVVPVGEAYLVAGETQVTLDAPAYISAAGYTMLPVRAVSKALGVDTNNVLWSAETKTVTIMYAQRIITMTVGQKTIYVNGSAIPASAAPEIKDGRTFLPLRDLGTALGVTNVAWDATTKTATLN